MKFIMNFLLLVILFIQFFPANAYLQTVTERLQSKHLIESEIRSCSTKIIGKYPHKNRRTQIYSSDFDDSAEYPFKNSKVPIQGQVPSLLSRITDMKHDHFPFENFCLVEVANKGELQSSLYFLYNQVHYRKCVVNVFFHTDGARIIQGVVDRVWKKGYSMNVRFIVFMEKLNRTIVLGASPYVSPGTCKDGKLIEWGRCENGTVILYQPPLYPPIKNFGGCNITFMIQPPFLPYIENKGPNPGGVTGNILRELGRLMNFKPIYVWKYNVAAIREHYNKHNLNVVLNLIPRVPPVLDKYRFSIGLIQKVFIIPRGDNVFRLNELLNPIDGTTWICIFVIFLFIIIICYTVRQTESVKIIFDIYGIFLGVSVGELLDIRWFKCFLFFFLLPSFVFFQAYLASITENLSTPGTFQEIFTMNDLMESDLNILCDKEIRDYTCAEYKSGPKKLCDYCTNVTDKYLYNEFFPNLFKTGMLNNSAVEINKYVLLSHPNIHQDVNVIENSQISLNQFAKVRAGNDYIFEMAKVFRKFAESGIVNVFVDRFATYKGPFTKKKKYEMKYKLLYIIMIPGWIISLIAFLGEIVVHKCSRKQILKRKCVN